MTTPIIAGLMPVRPLGAGGFAEVFLYEQDSPRRQVAVKVLRSHLDDRQVSELGIEANLLARLEHPHIVPIYATGRTHDGREYISMMYYPKGSLDTRLRAGRFETTEVLRLGVQLAGALETAHQAGILHLDVKPVNILVNQYGQPGLADFGISRTTANANQELESLSVPWAAPELITRTGRPSVATDIYSLAATLWHLLAGHSPFMVPEGNNQPDAIMSRVAAGQITPIKRPDVPPVFTQYLRQAMSLNPAERPVSVADFAFGLQQIENRLGWPVTDLVVPEIDSVPGPSQQLREDWISQTQLVPKRFDRIEQQTPRLPGDATRVRVPNPPVKPKPAGKKWVFAVIPLLLALIFSLSFWLWPKALAKVDGFSVSGEGHQVSAVTGVQVKMAEAGGIKAASPLVRVTDGVFPAIATWRPPAGQPTIGNIVFLTRQDEKSGWRAVPAKWSNGIVSAPIIAEGEGIFVYHGAVSESYRQVIADIVAERLPDRGCPQHVTAPVGGPTYKIRPEAYSIRGCMFPKNDQPWFQLYNFDHGYVWRIEPDPQVIKIQPSSAEDSFVGQVTLAARAVADGSAGYATLPLYGLATFTLNPGAKDTKVTVKRDKGLTWLTAHLYAIDRTVTKLAPGTALLTKDNVKSVGVAVGECVGKRAKAAVTNEDPDTRLIVRAADECIADELAVAGAGNSEVAVTAAVMSAYAQPNNQVIKEIWGPGLSRNVESYIEIFEE